MRRIADIWGSFRRLPLWVQVWVALILVPVNMASLVFAGYPGGALLAGLAVGGMLPNIVIMVAERGLSKAMALPHLLLWTPLVALVAWQLYTYPGFPPMLRNYLWLLLAVDLVSLVFDYPDALSWKRGDRAVA